MGMMGAGSIAILPTSPLCIRNRDVSYPYRPDSDFYYLTAFPEPEAVAVLLPDHPRHQYILFCHEQPPAKALWEGAKPGPEAACEHFDADAAWPLTEMSRILRKLLENRRCVYYHFGSNPELDHSLPHWIDQIREHGRSGVHAPSEFISLHCLTHEMRLFKSRHEIATMRKAARISAQAHQRAMRVCRPGMTEYQLEAELMHEFMRQGARQPAYPSIVGSGTNSCTLHYTRNTATLQAGELVLIDAGAELAGYASDISRTFPVGGCFSATQRAVYEVVLAAQTTAIDHVRPGAHWDAPHQAALRVITEGLVELGILQGDIHALIEQKAFRDYYMHYTGHWLGMDVHDVGEYKVDGEWRMFEPGMTLTVEPGLYLRAGSPGLDEKWWDIGIRIEDDVLVTRDGAEVLSRDAPKAIDEIEALMADATGL